MSQMYRRVTPKVKLGTVAKKNNWETNRIYDNLEKDVFIIDKEEAGYGYKHLLKKKHIFEFIELLPDWNELSNGLRVILLASGDDGTDGWHNRGTIAICAWEKDLWREFSANYFNEHKTIFDRLDIKYENYLVKFTENQARAYQLLHIFLHELGHHHDRMTTRYKVRSSRGEKFAEEYANNYSEQIWESYLRKFDID